MDIYDFIRLNQEQREALVWEKGTFLAVRYSRGTSVCLYYMGKFYAEVVYLSESNEVLLVRGFRTKSCLEPYLDMVDLSDMMALVVTKI